MDVKDAQVAYHDWEAPHYDAKWSISFDRRCVDYAAGRYRRAVPDGRGYDDVLEVGCGTGFFLLNLWQAGFVGTPHCTDIAPSMVARCEANGAALGVTVHGRVADAEALPYDDASFDLVVGHAVLHHLPDVRRGLAELVRVLRPGGRLLIAGEPTVLGDRVAGWCKRGARISVKLAALVAGSRRVLDDGLAALPPTERHAAALEAQVDLHTFAPDELERLVADAGLAEVACRTEELTASWFGWAARTVEGMTRDELRPAWYPQAAYRAWLGLSAIDEQLRGLVPREVFYNAVVTGLVPGAPDRGGPRQDARRER